MAASTAQLWSRSGGGRVGGEEEARMDEGKRDTEDLPHKDQQEIEREARKNRKELDEVPEHGTDPLHEGP
jgi:hypothetical protein